MFTQFFGMKYNPFGKELDINDAYESEDMKELSSRFKYIQASRGMFFLIGEPGTGKSTALRKFAAGLNPGLYKPCYFTLSTVTVMDFYRGILISLGETPSFKKVTMFHQIQEAINLSYYEHRITPVIMLDEVHLLSNSILEDIRLLFSFKMDSENPYILILSGQSQLRNKLQLSVNAPLKQRISIKYAMQGLKKEELTDYLTKRLKSAGMVDNIFTSSAIEVIYAISKGVPRMINNLATASLMYACSKRQNEIDEETVYQGQKDFDV
jgi:type II secretory pathway predicted ATPase ExeA